MAEMLLINPRRRKARKSTARRSAAQRAATRRLVAMNKARRRRNPAPAVAALNPRRRRRSVSRMARVARRVYRRRRSNPSMRFSFAGVMREIQGALVQGAGAVAFDIAHGQIQRFLPAALVPVPGQIGIGDAVKAAITVFVGTALRGVTRGLSVKAATGALTVQAHGLIRQFVPSTLPLGYAVPGQVAQGMARVGPNRAIVGVGRYTAPGATPLLNRYTQPGASPLLNAARTARAREGVAIR
jgi:hypothetical protein